MMYELGIKNQKVILLILGFSTLCKDCSPLFLLSLNSDPEKAHESLSAERKTYSYNVFNNLQTYSLFPK